MTKLMTREVTRSWRHNPLRTNEAVQAATPCKVKEIADELNRFTMTHVGVGYLGVAEHGRLDQTDEPGLKRARLNTPNYSISVEV